MDGRPPDPAGGHHLRHGPTGQGGRDRPGRRGRGGRLGDGEPHRPGGDAPGPHPLPGRGPGRHHGRPEARMTVDAATLSRYADLIVGFGANVQPGQTVYLGSEVGKEDLTRAVVEACYRREARFVDVDYFDPWAKRARLLGAAAEAL